jgi:hypothetical protein
LIVKRIARTLLCTCSLLSLAVSAQGADPRLWRFPLYELVKQNTEESIDEGADNVYVWACKPGMQGETSANASTLHTIAPAGGYELVLRVKPLDFHRLDPVLRLIVREDGVATLADITLAPTDFEPSGRFFDWRLPLAKSLDDSSLSWTLSYLGHASISVDEMGLVPVHRQGDAWPEVEIMRLGPAGLVNNSGIAIPAEAVVTNHTLERQSVALSVRAEVGIDESLWHVRRALDLEPLDTTRVELPSDYQGRQWGVGLHAELSRDGQLLDRRSELFAIADNFNQVSQFGAASLDNDVEHAPGLAVGYRTAGIGALEVDFWAPCDFSRLAPAEDEWISGQGLRRVRKVDLQQGIAAVRGQGLRVLTYGDMWLCGPAGFEWARRHPQQTIWDHSWYGGEYDVDQLDALRAGNLKQSRQIGGWTALTPRLTDPAVQRLEAEQIVASVQMFGWDGIRYDNNGLVAIGGKDLLGRDRPPDPPDDTDQASADMIRRLRRQVATRYPRFVFGDNTGGRFAIKSSDAKWRAEAADGGLIMEEGVGQLSAEGDWSEMARRAVLTARTAKACGGYQVDIVTTLIPKLNWSARPYCYALELAAGAHVAYAAPEHAMRPFCLFALRYGELLYDLGARPLEGDENPFQTFAAVWWKDYATRRDLPGGRRQYILGLVQPPPVKRVSDAFPLVKPLSNLPVRFRSPAGERITRAWALEPEPQPRSQRLQFEAATTAQLIVPRLHYWTVLVVETLPQHADRSP